MSVDDERLEMMLAALPRRRPDPRREAELMQVLMTAEQRGPWWRRPVPLWQTAAMCAAVAVASVGLLRGGPADGLRREAPAVVYVEARQPLFESNGAIASRLDISRWKVLPARAEGVERP